MGSLLEGEELGSFKGDYGRSTAAASASKGANLGGLGIWLGWHLDASRRGLEVIFLLVNNYFGYSGGLF